VEINRSAVASGWLIWKNFYPPGAFENALKTIFERSAVFDPYPTVYTNYVFQTSILRQAFLFACAGRKLTMRIILQNNKSLLYFKMPNEWTSHIHDASDFQGVVKAFDYVHKTRLPSMDVLMHFGDPVYDVRLRVSN